MTFVAIGALRVEITYLLLKDAEKFKNVFCRQFKVTIHVFLISDKTGLCT